MKLILILILSFCGVASASATEKIINYDDFVHLSYPKQVEAIKLVHTFLIEYEHQIFYQDMSRNKTTQYQTYKKIIGFFLSSAHANDSELFNQIPDSMKCYYGGWISYMRPNSSGKSYCVHPKDMAQSQNLAYLAKAGNFTSKNDPKFKKSPIYKYYIGKISDKYDDYFKKGAVKTTNVGFDSSTNKLTLTEASGTCASKSSQSSITCNPDIYGFYKGSALCIKSKRSYGVNTSFLCSKALEHIEKIEPEAYKETMRDIINRGINSETGLFDTLKAMYDTCLCGGDAGSKSPVYFQNSMSADYASRIFKSRTCAGILSQTQLLNEAYSLTCNEDSSKFDNNKQRDWIKFLNKTSSVLQRNMDELRSKIPTNLSSKKLSRSNIQNMFAADEKLYRQIAEDNFASAKANNLCPVMKTKPELLASYDAVNKVLTVTPLGESEEEIDIQNLEITHIQDLEGETAASSVPQSSNQDTMRSPTGKLSYLYDVTPAPKESKAKAFATYNGQPIESNTVTIDGIETDKPGISLSYIEHGQVKLVITGVDKKDLSKYKTSIPTLVGTIAEGKVNPTITIVEGGNPEAMEQTYNVTQIETDYKLSSTLTLEEATEPIASAEVNVPKENENKLEFKNISYQIFEEKLYNLVELNLMLKGEEAKANEAIELQKLSLQPTGSVLEKKEGVTNYVLATPSEEIELKAVYTKDASTPTIISNQDLFGPPLLDCKMTKAADGEDMLITFVPSLKEGVTLPDFDFSKPEIMSNLIVSHQGKSISPAEGETNKVKIEGFDSEEPVTATAQVTIANVVSGIACGEDEAAEVEAKPTESELASCKIEIKNTKDDKGKSNLSYEVTFIDSNGDDLTKVPSALDVEVSWFNHSLRAGKEKTKEKTSSGMAGNVEEEEEGDVEEKKEEKKEESAMSKKIAELKKKFKKEKGPKLSVTQGSRDKKYTAVVTAKAPYQDKCNATTSYTVKKKTIKAPNDSGNFLQGPNTNMVRPSGSFMGGQR
jgi:hypothetical protein